MIKELVMFMLVSYSLTMQVKLLAWNRIPSMIKVWINCKTRRYYTVHLAEDLLGDWVLLRSWGSLDSGAGNIRKDLVTDYRSGCLEVESIASTRQAHGYLMVEGEK
jgi:hypothetical protein